MGFKCLTLRSVSFRCLRCETHTHCTQLSRSFLLRDKLIASICGTAFIVCLLQHLILSPCCDAHAAQFLVFVVFIKTLLGYKVCKVIRGGMACKRRKEARSKGGVAIYARTSSKTNENGVQVPNITWRYVKLCMMLWWCKLQVQAPDTYCNMAGKPSKANREC